MISTNPTQLQKSMGLFRLTTYGVGTIIGAGIYSVISVATQVAGNGVWLSFVLAAIAAMFSALSYAELTSALPSAGAEYNFLKQAFPKFPIFGFLVGLFIAIHSSATLATVALTFSQYANKFIALNPKFIALGLISILTYINIIGLKRASWVNVIFTSLQLIGLLTLCSTAFLDKTFLSSVEKIISSPIETTKVFSATAIIFFIYTGYEHLASLSEEVKQPEKNIWKAFIAALIITTIIYLSIIFSVLHLIGSESLASSQEPLAVAGRHKSFIIGYIITLAALLATSNAVLSGSISASRLLYGMARDGDLPRSLTKINTQKTPWFAALIAMGLALLIVLLGEIKLAASLSSLGALLVFASIHSATIWLRLKKPDLKRPFRIPLSIRSIPIFPVFGLLVSLALTIQFEIKIYIIFAIGILIGFGIYKLRSNRLRQQPQTSPKSI